MNPDESQNADPVVHGRGGVVTLHDRHDGVAVSAMVRHLLY